MSKTFTTADVAAHKTASDLYIIVDGDVYDLTKFQEDHPGSSPRPFCPSSLTLLLRLSQSFPSCAAASSAPH